MSRISTRDGVRVPFRVVIASILGLWATYFLLATLRWQMLGFGHDALLLERRVIFSIAGIAVTLALWLLLRLFDRRRLWAKVIAALLLSMPASILLAQVNSYVFQDINEAMERKFTQLRDADPLVDVPWRSSGAIGGEQTANNDRANSGDSAAEKMAEDFYNRLRNPKKGMQGQIEVLTEIAFARYFMMLAWCALYLAMLTGEKARIAERREHEFRNAAKAAELRSLRYQVNPHFLFNTLNSLSALVITGKTERAEQMIQTISRFYRHSLADDPTSDVSLEDEFDLLKLYLDIEKTRFPNRLNAKFDLPPDLAQARVPGMILQPLVENSVKYAVSPVNRPVTITLAAREEFESLVLTISDDGPGTPEGAASGFGIGLANVRDRLEARFGPDIALVSGPVEGGYRTEIRIPLTYHG